MVKKPPQVIVTQIGRREHYAVPLALEGAGMLSHFFTDGYVGPASWCHRFARLLSPDRPKGILARALSRTSTLPDEKVTAYNWLGLRYTWKLRQANSEKQKRMIYLWCAQEFNKLILQQQKVLSSAQAIYALNGVSLELFAFGRDLGLKLLLNQIDPSLYEQKLVIEESNLWPEWETEPAALNDDELHCRERTEWSLADLVVVNSLFSKQALVSLGVPASKIRVVPLSVDTTRFRPANRPPKRGPIKFLFLGSVGLRKGIHYALKAFRELRSRQVNFTIVGPLDGRFRKEKLLTYAEVSNYIGPVPGQEVVKHYQEADVFIFPTISDGFGLTQLEALACGLPVITTPNAGSVVRDGVEGFIVPIRDYQALAEKIDLLLQKPELLTAMSQNARQRARDFGPEKYSERLIRTIYQGLELGKDN